jgi:callose synthase
MIVNIRTFLFQAHIHNVGGRILETVLSLRFFIFQYGVVYHMDASESSKALLIYWISWAVLGGLFVLLLVCEFLITV